jgi:nucleotide-binding universal stress UspA family protein
VSAEVTTGHAPTEIVNYARKLGVDIAVIGSKGVRLLEEAVIGGTAEHVVKKAGCSVLVVKD